MKCDKCGYDDNDSGDMAHVCQRPSYRYGEHPISFGLAQPEQEPVLYLVNGVVQSSDIPEGFTGCLYTTPPQPEQDSVAMADYMALVEKYALLKASKPEQEPVAWEKCQACGAFASPTPPQRTWVGLTDKEIETIYRAVDGNEFPIDFYKEIEAKLKEKNQ